MKKFIIAIAFALTSGVLALQTKVNNRSVILPVITKGILSADSKELASGD